MIMQVFSHVSIFRQSVETLPGHSILREWVEDMLGSEAYELIKFPKC